MPVLPELEDEAFVTEARGVGSSYDLLVAYDRVLEALDRTFQYHMELLNLGYVAYLVFYELCRQAFPDITDQAVARMVSGIDLLVLRPDEELKRLAGLAVELGVAGAVQHAADEEALREALSRSDTGARWLADFDGTKDPWFHFSNGSGVYHHHRSWIDDTRLPISAIASYTRRLEAGEDIARPSAAVHAERERITDEYRSLLPVELCVAFDETLTRARTIFPFVENHQFYIEHQFFTIFWNKVREFGAALARGGSWARKRTSSTCDTTRFATHSRSSASTGAPVAPGPLAVPASGPRSSTVASQSTRRCAHGPPRKRWARLRRRSPTR